MRNSPRAAIVNADRYAACSATDCSVVGGRAARRARAPRTHAHSAASVVATIGAASQIAHVMTADGNGAHVFAVGATRARAGTTSAAHPSLLAWER